MSDKEDVWGTASMLHLCKQRNVLVRERAEHKVGLVLGAIHKGLFDKNNLQMTIMTSSTKRVRDA
jgi:hypothetical protein